MLESATASGASTAVGAGEIRLDFSEAVSWLRLDDLVLKRNGQVVSWDGQGLETEDGIQFRITNLEELTGTAGDYELSYEPSGDFQVEDVAGNTAGSIGFPTFRFIVVKGDASANQSDTVRVAPGSGANEVQVFLNGTQIHAFTASDVGQVIVDGLGGNDTFIDELPSGLKPSAGIFYRGGSGANWIEVYGTSDDDIMAFGIDHITSGADEDARTLEFVNVNTVTLISSSGSDDITVSDGVVVLQNGQNLWGAGSSLTVSGGIVYTDGGLVNFGQVTQTGGSVSVDNSIELNTNITYSLSDGTFYIPGNLTLLSGASFSQSGGNVSVTTLYADGSYSLTGGVLGVQSLEISSGGSLSFWGGDLAGGFNNNGSISVGGGGTRSVSNYSVNYGTIKTYDTNFDFQNGFDNYGSYYSDPADNFFTNLTIGSSGYLLGGVGDRFFVSGNLISHSTRKRHWNTIRAELHFVGAGEHVMGITGVDRGDKGAAYIKNFAWGVLGLASGAGLSLVDGDDVAGGALYVDRLVLADGIGQLAAIDSGGFNIYYNADAAENAYLSGLSYQLTGGGWLRPSYAGAAIAGAEDVTETAAMSGAAGMPPREEVLDKETVDPLAG